VNEQPCQTAQGNPQPEEIGVEIGLIKLVKVHQHAYNHQDQTNDLNDNREALNPIQIRI
jgi:hypothetical protein